MTIINHVSPMWLAVWKNFSGPWGSPCNCALCSCSFSFSYYSITMTHQQPYGLVKAIKTLRASTEICPTQERPAICRKTDLVTCCVCTNLVFVAITWLFHYFAKVLGTPEESWNEQAPETARRPFSAAWSPPLWQNVDLPQKFFGIVWVLTTEF